MPFNVVIQRYSTQCNAALRWQYCQTVPCLLSDFASTPANVLRRDEVEQSCIQIIRRQIHPHRLWGRGQMNCSSSRLKLSFYVILQWNWIGLKHDAMMFHISWILAFPVLDSALSLSKWALFAGIATCWSRLRIQWERTWMTSTGMRHGFIQEFSSHSRAFLWFWHAVGVLCSWVRKVSSPEVDNLGQLGMSCHILSWLEGSLSIDFCKLHPVHSSPTTSPFTRKI